MCVFLLLTRKLLTILVIEWRSEIWLLDLLALLKIPNPLRDLVLDHRSSQEVSGYVRCLMRRYLLQININKLYWGQQEAYIAKYPCSPLNE